MRNELHILLQLISIPSMRFFPPNMFGKHDNLFSTAEIAHRINQSDRAKLMRPNQIVI